MLTVFYEASGEAGLRILNALMQELQRDSECRDARLLAHTQEPTFLIISSWAHPPQHPLPPGVRSWAFRDVTPQPLTSRPSEPE